MGEGTMRPQSITTFERLYLAGIAVSIVGFVLDFNKLAGATVSGTPVNPAIVIAGFGISIAIYLLLWFLVAKKASNIARWVVVVVFILGLAGLPVALSPPFGLTKVLSLLLTALHFAAIVFLFRKDASDWLAQKGNSSTGE
jgi:uncharacterized membrane protein